MFTGTKRVDTRVAHHTNQGQTFGYLASIKLIMSRRENSLPNRLPPAALQIQADFYAFVLRRPWQRNRTISDFQLLYFQENNSILAVGKREGVREGSLAADRADLRAQGHHRAAARRWSPGRGLERAGPSAARWRLSTGEDRQSCRSVTG